MAKVSIVVPVYKVESYLRRCLDSIVSQTYKNIEVILVDDESPDNCGQICEEYASKYPYITVLHQKNQGLSGARNSGAKIATGDYVTFIDSDDFVTNDYVEYLMDLIELYDADVSVASFIYQYDTKPMKTCREESLSQCLSPLEAIKRMNYGHGMSVTAWAKMYKKELVLRYPYPVGRIYEDVATTYKIIGDCKNVAVGNKQIYYWIQRVDSIMHSNFSEKQYDGLKSATEQLEYVKQRYPDAVNAAQFRYAAKCVELMALCFLSGAGHSEYKRLKDYAAPLIMDVCRDPNAKRSIKLRLISMRIGYFPAKFAFWVHEKAKQRLV